MQNKTIITGIETQNSEQSVFCVLTPVIRDLQLEAILQASVDVNRLLQKSQSERIQAPLNSWIVLLDGSVLYTVNPNESHYSNLYALLKGNSNSETTLQQIRTTPADRQFRYIPNPDAQRRRFICIFNPISR